MAMKYLFFFYCLAVPALAIGALDVDGSCRAQFHPIHESGSNVAIAGFLWDSLHQSDSEYAALLVPVLMKNKVYGINYGGSFMSECLESNLSIREVIDKLRHLVK